MGLRRLLPIPAGRWPFPTLSLHSLCGCLDQYPGMSHLCVYPFLPEVQRPSPKVQGARPIRLSPQSSFNGASKFRGCSHSLMFRPPHSLGLPAAPTAGKKVFLGGQAIYTAQNPVGYLPRAAASLHARIGQLAWLDSHQLECSLVGCSRTRRTTDEVSWSHRNLQFPSTSRAWSHSSFYAPWFESRRAHQQVVESLVAESSPSTRPCEPQNLDQQQQRDPPDAPEARGKRELGERIWFSSTHAVAVRAVAGL
jgi:hypothetical protein